MKNLPRPLILATFLTGTYLIALAFNLIPWLRGPTEWRWAYALPGTIARLWLPAVLLSSYAVIAYQLQRRTLTRRVKVLALLSAALMVPALQLALLYMDHPNVLSPLFYRTVSATSGGYFNLGSGVTNTINFLQHYVEYMPTYPIHVQTHPPGLPLLFAWARQFFDQQPALAQNLSAVLRPFQCHNLPLMNLPDSAITSASVQMLLPLLFGNVVWPLYRLGREVYDEPTALRAILIWPLLPSIALFATRWDEGYPIFIVLALLLFHLGLSRRRGLFLFFSGIICSLSLFLSTGNVIIAELLGVYAALWLLTNSPRPTPKWLILGTLAFVLGGGLLWIVLRVGYNLDPIALWRTGLNTHLGLVRSYATWLFFNLYDFGVFMGIPICVWWLAQSVSAIRNTRTRRNPIDVLTIAFGVSLLVLDISGVVRGEIARLWILWLPLPVLSAAYRLPQKSLAFVSVVILLSLQVFVGNIFLRVVGTGLSNPPDAPTSIEVNAQFPMAEWQGGPTLQSIDMPPSIAAGQALPIQIVWTTSQQIDRPYTLFIHVVDAQGQLIAQHDGMPLTDTWPTTCWRPNENFVDAYTLNLPAPLTAGIYHLELGFYSLPDGERLSLVTPSNLPERSLTVGSVEVR